MTRMLKTDLQSKSFFKARMLFTWNNWPLIKIRCGFQSTIVAFEHLTIRSSEPIKMMLFVSINLFAQINLEQHWKAFQHMTHQVLVSSTMDQEGPAT